MGRTIIILVLGAIIGYGITNITLNEYISQGTQNSVDDYSYNRVRDIGNGMVDIILMRIANNEGYRVNSPITQNLNGGYATYTAEDSFFDGDSLIKIIVAANYRGTTKSITAYAKPFALELDFGLSAVTANSEIKVNGNFLIDARNHTAAGVLIPQDGTYALWSSNNIIPTGNFTGGGTFNSVDYIPQKPPDPAVIASNQIWPGGYPTTPEQVFGNYPPGSKTLKEFAQTGQNGSQYVTDPSLLTYPLQGVTYVDLPPGGTWMNANLTGNGIVVVHNNDRDATLMNPQGTFTGLLIIDGVQHFKGDIIGAVVSLAPPSAPPNYIIGNSSGSILYSKAAVENSIKKVKLLLYGFGKKRLHIKHWSE
jgi:hypothetical protein